VRNRISNPLPNSPLRAMRFGARVPMSAEIAHKINTTASRPNIVLTLCLANLRKLKRADYLASRYSTLNGVDAMFVHATVL
jgi:hypothetical protein